MAKSLQRTLRLIASYDGKRLDSGIQNTITQIRRIGEEAERAAQRAQAAMARASSMGAGGGTGGVYAQQAAGMNQAATASQTLASAQDDVARAAQNAGGVLITNKGAIQDVGYASRVAAVAQRDVASAATEVSTQTETLTRRASKAAGGFDEIAITARYAAASMLLFGAPAAALSMEDMSQKTENATRSLSVYTGTIQEADRGINLMQDSLDGTINKMEAATLASQLFQFKIVDTVEEAALLARAVTLVGDKSFTAARRLEYLVFELNNMSGRRLDTLGLSITEVEERTNALKASTKGLTDQQVYQEAVIGALTDKLGAFEEAGVRAGTSQEAIGSTMADLGATIGSAFTPIVEAANAQLGIFVGLADKARSISPEGFSFGGSIAPILPFQNSLDGTLATMEALRQAGDYINQAALVRNETQRIFNTLLQEGVEYSAMELTQMRIQAEQQALINIESAAYADTVLLGAAAWREGAEGAYGAAQAVALARDNAEMAAVYAIRVADAFALADVAMLNSADASASVVVAQRDQQASTDALVGTLAAYLQSIGVAEQAAYAMADAEIAQANAAAIASGEAGGLVGMLGRVKDGSHLSALAQRVLAGAEIAAAGGANQEAVQLGTMLAVIIDATGGTGALGAAAVDLASDLGLVAQNAGVAASAVEAYNAAVTRTSPRDILADVGLAKAEMADMRSVFIENKRLISEPVEWKAPSTDELEDFLGTLQGSLEDYQSSLEKFDPAAALREVLEAGSILEGMGRPAGLLEGIQFDTALIDNKLAAQDLRDELEKLGKEAEKAGEKGSASSKKAKSDIEKQAEAAAKAAKAAAKLAGKTAEEQEEAARRAYEAWIDAADKYEQAWERAAASVRGAVSGALKLGFESPTAEDFLLDQFGLRIEGPNEVARRLQDVVNRGTDSPWFVMYAEALGLFGGSEDEVKARAARALQDFEEGLIPELIDKERLKNVVRRALQGQANLDRVIEEVTQELLAEGWGMAELGKALRDQFGDDIDIPGLVLDFGFAPGMGNQMIDDMLSYIRDLPEMLELGENIPTVFLQPEFVIDPNAAMGDQLISILGLLDEGQIGTQYQRQMSDIADEYALKLAEIFGGTVSDANFVAPMIAGNAGSISDMMLPPFSDIMRDVGEGSAPKYMSGVLTGLDNAITNNRDAIIAQGKRMGEYLAIGIAEEVAGQIIAQIADAVEEAYA